MILDLFTFKIPEKDPEEVGEEVIQPDMTTCPEVVTDSILDIAGNASDTSTSGQLSETFYEAENHQIIGYLFSDHISSLKRFEANSSIN